MAQGWKQQGGTCQGSIHQQTFIRIEKYGAPVLQDYAQAEG